MNDRGLWYLAARHEGKLKSFAVSTMTHVQVSNMRFNPDPVVSQQVELAESIWYACPSDNAPKGFSDIADRFARNFAAKHPYIAAEAGQFINQLYRPVVEMNQSP